MATLSFIEEFKPSIEGSFGWGDRKVEGQKMETGGKVGK